MTSGELPGTRLACQIMDEIVYPLATAPPARAGPAPDTSVEGSRMGDGTEVRARKATP
ncbi:MAG TPA: hypothetical protein VGI74_18430 [Streptosporangiaceae bacterium]